MKKLRSRRGAAMIIALVLMMVISSACLSLNLLAAKNQTSSGVLFEEEQASVLAVGLAKELITDLEAEEPGADSIGAYVAEHLGEDWTWYEAGSLFHGNQELVTRSFSLTEANGETSLSMDRRQMEAQVSLYWTSDETSENRHDPSGRILTLICAVTVINGSSRTTESVTANLHYATASAADAGRWVWTGELR